VPIRFARAWAEFEPIANLPFDLFDYFLARQPSNFHNADVTAFMPGRPTAGQLRYGAGYSHT
jgi:hypothetical protein